MEDQVIKEYSVSGMKCVFTTNYREWIHQIVLQMQFAQIKPFSRQTQLARITAELEQEAAYIVNYQVRNGDNNFAYQLVYSYADESRCSIIVTRQNITRHMKEHDMHLAELEKDSIRFRFIISHLCENFGEIHVKTGKTWMTTCNDWEVSQGNLKEQIQWFADNLIVPEQREAYQREFELNNLEASLRTNNGFYTLNFEALYPEGRRHLLIINALLPSPDNPGEEYIFGFVQDVTQLKKQEEKNRHLLDISQELLILSQTDSLTRLYNRVAGEKQIQEYFQTKSRHAYAALLIVDIDYFKKFNDQYGHPVGDSVLKYLASSMQDTFRSSDILCRWGGDEFLIFMPNINDRAFVEEKIEILQQKMYRHLHNRSPLPITLSIGGVMFKWFSSPEALYEEADKYLYQVKQNGRDGYLISVETT